jgi:hypothetical protein
MVYQVRVEVRTIRGELRTEVVDNVDEAMANEWAKAWARPRWWRWSRTLTLVWPDLGLTATYRWSDVLSLRIQPYREVCSS